MGQRESLVPQPSPCSRVWLPQVSNAFGRCFGRDRRDANVDLHAASPDAIRMAGFRQQRRCSKPVFSGRVERVFRSFS
jgi:hypothetical protein